MCCYIGGLEFLGWNLPSIPLSVSFLLIIQTMARPDLQKGLSFRDTRQRADLLPIQHRLSLPGKYSWIPVIIKNTYKVYLL